MTRRSPVLEVDRLRVVFRTHARRLIAVDDASIAINPGEAVGIVGESGSGKSTLARAVVGLLPDGASNIEAGRIFIHGAEVPTTDLGRLRGKLIAMVFQDPLSYLNPIMRVGKQIAESIRLHDHDAAVVRRIEELLELVRLPARYRHSYPHELSGGMRQRVLLAMALGCRPEILIADEPTTALDVTTQREILDLIRTLQSEFRMALLLVSHDLGVIASMCERVYVMYRGRIIETARTNEIFAAPAHAYTVGLFNAARALRDSSGRYVTMERDVLCDARHIAVEQGAVSESIVARSMHQPILELRGVSKAFRQHNGELHHAVNDVDIVLHQGESVALVGESGSGKSTVVRMALALLKPDRGDVQFLGRSLVDMSFPELRLFRTKMQPVFQDAGAALNPRRTVMQVLAQASWMARLKAPQLRDRILELLEQVRLTPGVDYLDRFPHELSGGQRQRLAIARAIAPDPVLIIADEPLSGADASIRGQILNLLLDLQAARGMAYLLVLHDISIAHTFAHRVAIMCRGSIVEHGAADEVISRPTHPYTQQLIEASKIWLCSRNVHAGRG